MTMDMLRQHLRPDETRGAQPSSVPVYWKTGTSWSFRDAWTAGVFGPYVLVVWVGNFDRTPLRDSSGVMGAGPIFHAVMLAAQHRVSSGDEAILEPTPDLEEVTICALSGMPANAWCPLRKKEWLPASAEALPCSWHHEAPEGIVTIYPAEYRAWAAEATKSLYSEATEATEDIDQKIRKTTTAPWPLTRRTVPSTALTISNPPAGALYSIDPTLRPEFQALSLRVISDRPTTIKWSINGSPLG